MVQIKNRERLKYKMRQILIGGGLEGISQTEIITKCRTYNTKANPNGFKGEDIRNILSDWRIRGLAQRFDVRQGYSKKPTRIWRATADIKTARL